MHARKMVAKGFTLVEILIVVVILGILAAIVIPQFTNASESAKASSLVSQLQTLRSQIELYRNQHGDLYPTTNGDPASAWVWTKMTLITDETGKTYATKAAADAAGVQSYGPYLQKSSQNPFTADPNKDFVSNAAGAAVGWVWDSSTRQMTASMSTAKYDELFPNGNTDIATYD